MKFLGIDPGVSGGIAAIDELGLVIATHKMPATVHDLVSILNGYSGERGLVATMELVHAGVFGAKKFGGRMGVVSAMTFGKNVGQLEGVLAAVGIRYTLVSPVVWQKAMSCRTGGDKNVSKRRAQQLFPRTSKPITHATADALLLAEYGRRTERLYRGQEATDGEKEGRSEEEGRTEKEGAEGGSQAEQGRSRTRAPRRSRAASPASAGPAGR